METWEKGWACLLDALAGLRPEDLTRRVRICGEELSVVEAINRQLTHYAQHVGQLVFLSKHLAGPRWKSLSIPRGQSARAWSYREEPKS